MEKLSLEEAISKLEVLAEELKSGKLNMDESIKAFEECKKLYEYANSLLKDIKQKVEIYNPEKGQAENFEEY